MADLIHPSQRGMTTTMIGIGISICLVLVKFSAGYFGHSYALIADGAETSADVLSSVLLWVGLRIALKPADNEHPYGHGKAEPLAGIVISLFLAGASVWIALHAIHYIITPHSLPRSFTLYVLAAIILIKEGMFRYVYKVGTEINSQAVKSDAYHHRSDAITSLAAFIGIVIALIGGKGYEGADDWAALIASVIIFYNAVVLIRPAIAEIMDTAPGIEIVNQVKEISEQVTEVQEVEKCYVRKMGFDYYVDLHILVDAGLTVEEGHRISHIVKQRLLDSEMRIANALIHIEPYYKTI